jgi:hypothetical protein
MLHVSLAKGSEGGATTIIGHQADILAEAFAGKPLKIELCRGALTACGVYLVT